MSTAVVISGPGAHRLVPHEPTPPGPGEALVRVHAVGVCGSDLDVLRGVRPAGYVRYPLTPGHEWSGTVESVGDLVPEALVGRKAVGEGFRNCQVCERCRAGENTLCGAGYEETGFTRPGATAATLTLPARLLHVLPDDTDLTAAALLEPAACVAAAVLKAAVLPGERVAVVGDGTAGMLAVQFMAAASPARLTVVGPCPGRRERALSFGATDCGAYDRSLSRAPDFDVVVETTGRASSVNFSMALLRRGGRLVLAGTPEPGAAGIDPEVLTARQLRIQSVFGAATAAWTHAVRALGSGLLSPLPLITHELPLEAFPRAVALLEGGGPEVGKVLLKPNL
ncbi:zinc-dependent alcohol dehydrogenase [Streptomyces sp. NPDC003016]